MKASARLALAAAALAGSLAALAPGALAAGGGNGYAVTIGPSPLAGGTANTLTAKITDLATSSQTLGAVNLTAPSGFTVTSASTPSGTTTVVGNVVEIRNLDITPGHSVTATIGTTSACTSGSYAWSALATSAPDLSGKALTLEAAKSSLASNVGSSCSLAFVDEPADTIVTQTISASAFNPAGPALQVELLDGNGNVMTSSSAPVTMSLASNPGGGTLSGTTTQNASSGVATFGDLSIDAVGNGYALLASSPGFAPATSSSFNEVTNGTSCPPGQTCTTGADTPNSSFDMNTPPGNTQNNLSVTVDPGSGPLTCSGYTAQDPNWYGFDTTSTQTGKTITYQVQPTREGSSNVQFCLGAPYEFTARGGQPAPAGTLPDGTSGFIGLLPDCPISPPGPCVAARSTTPDPNSPTGVDQILKIEFPAGLPGDPIGRI